MRLPPEPTLRAAKRWLEVLPTSGGIARAQALFTTHNRYSDLTPTQYAAALSLLRDLGLLSTERSPIPPENRILAAIFEATPQPWVKDADCLVQTPGELPADILALGSALGLDGTAVFEQLVTTWGKVDTSIREIVGASGEAALVELLRRHTAGRVDHVSNWSDGFGYDIGFNQGRTVAHLEVKSSTRSNRFTAYLSRHEYNVMLRDEHWVLVALRMSPDLEIIGVGSVPDHWIRSNAPRDTHSSGSWAVCKLEIPSEVIESGIPLLRGSGEVHLPAW
ncbi:protein NO VEIN domain-containing protein [Williamsia phyllosphaerae]|uniref:protein NO VEIN domain-containing protein n=1 Tax=Williamsia phyllosphaerae TaxID=885042 RepID=UPI0016628F0E|nr:DUF3883 domain-containing protein [Williamsia phyllosphaerae]